MLVESMPYLFGFAYIKLNLIENIEKRLWMKRVMIKKRFAGVGVMLAAMMLFAVLSLFCIVPPQAKSVGETYAASPIGTANVIDTSQVGLLLYERLLTIRDGVAPDENYVSLRSDDFVATTSLNLSEITSSATLQTLTVSDFSALGLFDFSALEYLNLSKNTIKTLSGDTFLGMPNLVRLNVANNKITSVSFGGLTKLQELNAEFNAITEINLSIMKQIDNMVDLPYVNLAFNRISNMVDVVLPNGAVSPIYVMLLGNEIAFAHTDYYVSHKIELIIQKLGATNMTEKTPFMVYNSGSGKDYKVRFRDKSSALIYTTVSGGQTRSLAPGEYHIDFYGLVGDMETNLSAGPTDPIFARGSITITKAAPLVTVWVDGTQIDANDAFEGGIELKFDSESDDYVVKYRVNGGVWVVGNSVAVSGNGSYDIEVCAVHQVSAEVSFTSEYLYISFSIRNPWAVFQLFFIIFIIIGALGLGYLVYTSVVKRQN